MQTQAPALEKAHAGFAPPHPRPWGAARFVDWYFRDPRTGELVLYERPNLPIGLFFVLRGLGRSLRRRRRPPEPASWIERAVRAGATLALVWWSVDELARGTTPYRRTIGAVVLGYALVRSGDVGR